MKRLFSMVALSGLVLGGAARILPLKRTYPKKIVYIAFTEGVTPSILSESEREVISRQNQRANELRTQSIDCD